MNSGHDTLQAPARDGDSDSDHQGQTDRVVDWLLDGLEWQASVFHVGQYCGRWRASTAGRARASFHLILDGRCWLHRPGHASVALAPRDGVFLMRDVPHFLSPYSDPAIDCAPRAMQPLSSAAALGETGLACGFFSFDGPFRALVTDAFPDCLLLRADDRTNASAAMLFDLMRSEAHRAGSEPSALMDRLAGLLFFYGLRHVSHGEAQARGLWALLRRPGFAPLVSQLLQAPEQAWTVDEMAARVHLSRAAFFRQFAEACGQSPLQFLLLLRMQLAARRLAQGESIAQVAQAVGYESYAAFSRAFKRVIGAQPGAWQRARMNGHNSETLGH
jgi:AraC family transcriptional activator of mtrCDE